jgi:hypothetical protein
MIIPYQDYAQQIRAFSRSTMIYSSTEVSWSIWKRLLDNRSKTDEKPGEVAQSCENEREVSSSRTGILAMANTPHSLGSRFPVFREQGGFYSSFLAVNGFYRTTQDNKHEKILSLIRLNNFT